VSFLIPMFIYDLHCCKLRCLPEEFSASADS